MEAAVKSGARRVILVHTAGIYSKYKSASLSYTEIERSINGIIRNSSSEIGVLYLRPTMIFGSVNDKNISKFIKMVDALRVLPVVDHGNSLIQPVNGRDLGRAYDQVLNKQEITTGDYILSGGNAVTILTMLQLISAALGKSEHSSVFRSA